MPCVRVGLYLCKTLIGSDRVDLHVLALLDEPQVGIVGLVVVHVKRLPQKEREKKPTHDITGCRRESYHKLKNNTQ